ncbi:MAG: chorismate mutase [Clostridia bacterium]|nr:chorismate mutase [Clostridia bacterium]
MSKERKNDLTELRSEINEINDEMLRLFLRRMEVSGSIAAYKKEHGLPIPDQAREQEILAEVGEKAGAMAPYARRFFASLMELSRAYQDSLSSSEEVG